MAEPDDNAQIEPPRRWWISPVWLIPVGAVLIGAWLLYQNVISHGPQVTLAVGTAEGIDAGHTQVKVRSVTVGHVTDVRLADDYHSAIVTVQMDPGTHDLLAANSRFWVIKPRVGRGGISGLNTIISGAYIQLQPGDSDQSRHYFKVSDHPPALSIDKPGITIQLTSSGDNSLVVGDPVIYQGQEAGQIESAHFSLKNKQMAYQVFVRQPFSKLITDATQFWLRSGVSFHLGTHGVDVQLGSLQSVLAGGITFGQPHGVRSGNKVTDGAHYKLYQTHNAAVQDRFDKKIKYVVLLNDSVQGLSAGAPVEYRGIRVGTVEQVPFYPKGFHLQQFSETNFKIPVLIALEPQRRGLSWAHWTKKQWRQKNQKFFAHGLRATIKSANLLTGSVVVALTFDDNAPKFKPRMLGDYPLFPSEPSQITSIQQQLSHLMDTLNTLDLQPIAQQLQRTVKVSNASLEQIEQATQSINALLNQPGTQSLPAQLHNVLAQLHDTLANFQQGAPTYQRFNHTLERLNQVLDDLAPLARTLRNDPNALIFGRPEGQDPMPQAAP